MADNALRLRGDRHERVNSWEDFRFLDVYTPYIK
jgi:hypothetical protein